MIYFYSICIKLCIILFVYYFIIDIEFYFNLCYNKNGDKMIEKLEKDGVVFKDKNSVYIDKDVKIGKGTIIYPNVSIRGNCIIGENNYIDSYTIIEDSDIGSNNKIGPSAHIHSHSKIYSNTTIGNFVEIKNSILCNGVKAKHLTYIGDAYIGEDCNIGAGVVFANYKGIGHKKEQTKLGKNVFVGSNSVLVAPLTIGENSMIGASSTITESIQSNSLAISRKRQITKDGYFQNKKC